MMLVKVVAVDGGCRANHSDVAHISHDIRQTIPFGRLSEVLCQ
jgi:hypothetical protein